MKLTVFPHLMSTQGKIVNLSVSTFLKKLEVEAQQSTPKEKCKLWSPAIFSEGRRESGAALLPETDVVGLDVDKVTSAQIQELFAFLAPYEYIAHTTASHKIESTENNEKWRVILPLEHVVTEQQYKSITSFINKSTGDILDKQTLGVRRVFFVPTKIKGEVEWRINRGKLFPYKDVPQVPRPSEISPSVPTSSQIDLFPERADSFGVSSEILPPTVNNIVEYISLVEKDAGAGERHNQLITLSLILAKHDPTYEEKQVESIFSRLIKENNREGGTDTIGDVWEMYSSAARKIRGGVIKPEPTQSLVHTLPKGLLSEADKDKKKIEKAQERYVEEVVREGRVSLSPKYIYTKQEAEAQGLPHLFSVVEGGKTVYKEMQKTNEGQIYPITIPITDIKSGLDTDYWIQRGYKIFQIKVEYQKQPDGGTKEVRVARKMNAPAFMAQYVSKNTGVCLSTTLFDTQIAMEGRTMRLPLEGRVSYSPKQHDEVKELIRLLGGENHTKLRRWFELFADNSLHPAGRNTSGALSALVLIGKAGVGKSSIIDFLSAYVNPKVRNTLDTMAGDFTGALGGQFVVGQDETQTVLKPSKVHGFIRQHISANAHVVNKKFGARTQIQGYLRIVLAGNDYGILPSNGIETDDAREGSVVRFLINPLDGADQQRKLREFWDRITDEGRYDQLKQHFCEQLEWWKQNPQTLTPKEEKEKYGIKDLRFGVYSNNEKYTEMVASGAFGNISMQYFAEATKVWLERPELVDTLAENLEEPKVAFLKDESMYIRPTKLLPFLHQLLDKDDCERKHITLATLKKAVNTFKTGASKSKRSHSGSRVAKYMCLPKKSIYLLLRDILDRDEITHLLHNHNNPKG